MRKFESHWMSNDAWYHLSENGDWVVNDDAPKEAKDSYALYCEQRRKASAEEKNEE